MVNRVWSSRLCAVAESVALVLLVGCASIDSQIEPMVGRPVSVAVDKWGPPDQRLDVAGRSFYRWFSTGGDCEWSLEVDVANNIISYKSSGIACPVIGHAK